MNLKTFVQDSEARFDDEFPSLSGIRVTVRDSVDVEQGKKLQAYYDALEKNLKAFIRQELSSLLTSFLKEIMPSEVSLSEQGKNIPELKAYKEGFNQCRDEVSQRSTNFLK